MAGVARTPSRWTEVRGVRCRGHGARLVAVAPRAMTSEVMTPRRHRAWIDGCCPSDRSMSSAPSRGSATRSRSSTTPTAERRADGAASRAGPTCPRPRSSARRPTRPPTTGCGSGRPVVSCPFAGHPTIGSAHAWLEAGGVPRGDVLVQECGAGLVDVRRSPRLGFAAPPLRRSGPVDADLRARIVACTRRQRRDGRRTWRGSTTGPAGSASTSARPRQSSTWCPTSPPSPTSR